MIVEPGKNGVTIYSDGCEDGYDYGWVVVKDGRVVELGQDLGREGGVYWRRRQTPYPLTSLVKEAPMLIGKWGKDFYVEILLHAHKDAKRLPSPNVVNERYKDRVIKQKETEIRLKEETIRRLRKEIKEIRKGR